MLGVGAIAVCRNVGDLSVDSVSSSTCAFRDSPLSFPRLKSLSPAVVDFDASPFGLVASVF